MNIMQKVSCQTLDELQLIVQIMDLVLPLGNNESKNGRLVNNKKCSIKKSVSYL